MSSLAASLLAIGVYRGLLVFRVFGFRVRGLGVGLEGRGVEVTRFKVAGCGLRVEGFWCFGEFGLESLGSRALGA